MRLTPADVHNVAFKKPSIGKRGYDEDEVDAFLDLVEAELSRLIEENNELTQRANGGFAGVAPTEAAPEHQPEAVQEFLDQVPAESQHDHEAPEAPAVQPVTAVAPQGSDAPYVQAARLLGLAQETAERLTGEAAAEAESTRAQAKAESEKLVADAHAEAERLLSDAANRSGSMVEEATTRADTLERDSRVKADALDRESQAKYAQVMGQLTEQRTALEKKIDDLRVYEREYRSRLKEWITDQLTALNDGNGAAVNTDHLAQQGAE